MFLSSGKLVKNPQLITRYVEELRNRGLNPLTIVPGHEELEMVERAAKERICVLKIVEELIEHFKNRIVGVLAKNIVKEVLKEEVDEETAAYLIAKELAAWVLEIAESLNIVKIGGDIR
jgi:hypothetical protein